MEQEKKKKSKLMIIIPVLLIIIIAIVGIVTRKNKKETQLHQIGEITTKDCWEFTLTDVQYGKKLETGLAHENYCLPTDTPLNNNSIAKEGNTFIVITYDVKFIGKSNTAFDPRF